LRDRDKFVWQVLEVNVWGEGYEKEKKEGAGPTPRNHKGIETREQFEIYGI